MYKNKTEFIKEHSPRKLGILEYCLGLEKQGLDDKQIADKISKTSESELDYIRAYPVASQGKAAYVSNVESKNIDNFGGVLSNDKKQRKEELKTLSPDKLYYDSAQDAYVKIVTKEDGKKTVQIVSKR